MPTGINLDPVVDSNDAFDVLKITLKNYPNRGELTVLQDRHTFPVMNRWFRDDRRVLTGGTAISEQIVIDENGSAKMVKPREVHEGNTKDVTATLQLPWRGGQGDWDLETREVLMNSGSAKSFTRLCSLIKVRRASADLSIANLLEKRGWLAPNSTADDKNPHGMPYWLVPITSAQVASDLGGDHIGTNPVGYTDTAGIDATAEKYKLWRSYNDVWSNDDSITTEEDVRKMTRMHRRLKFQVPMNARDWESEAFSDFQGYVTEARLEGFEERARANNESLGADLAKYCGQTVVKGTPMNWCEDLDDVSTDPMYLINHRHWNVFMLEGDNFTETTTAPDRSQHRVLTTFVDFTFNFMTLNRRLCGGRIDYVA